MGVYRVCRDHIGASGVWCLGLRFREGLSPRVKGSVFGPQVW